MKVLLYGINYSPELVGVAKYTSEMAEWLVKQGHEVHVVTAPPYYPGWKVWPKYSKYFYSRSIISGSIVWRCPIFVPSRPSSILRILHLTSFVFSSALMLAIQLFWRPNLVFLVAPTLLCAPSALLFSKLSGAKSILHIQDFEVDALFGLDLLSERTRHSIFKRLAFYFESIALSKFDIVSSISPGMIKRLRDKGVSNKCISFLPNWSELNRFKNVEVSQKLIKELGIRGEKKVILYSGNMGEKQGLESIVLAAQKLQTREDLVFLLVGDGASKKYIRSMAIDLNLSNLVFAPLQAYEDLPSLLASADVHLVIQKTGVADAVLPSKLTNIFAVGGNAVITADISTTLGQLAEDYPGIAVIVQPESVESLLSGIHKALNMPRFNGIAQAYAQEFLDKEKILSRFFGELDE
ncbi:glycosyltransferase WbuB [Polynucleobacter sp. P1-05-14]|uniref:glycosyltransferase WbuB n=1 Tax=Polynucleobacter sp. P1-05-14 TaxID=1819732 RepID=UPI001C0CC628|nr:glycosyltransferase WbuB [Polynucleobacter sp. P1-05-14]MBU3548029.1 glycosyltransferase WbuB [Polynucleobacter sp. P1-05-14]